MSTYTVYQKAFYAKTKNCSVLLKTEFDINGTNSLRAGGRVLFPLLQAEKQGSLYTWCPDTMPKYDTRWVLM